MSEHCLPLCLFYCLPVFTVSLFSWVGNEETKRCPIKLKSRLGFCCHGCQGFFLAYVEHVWTARDPTSLPLCLVPPFTVFVNKRPVMHSFLTINIIRQGFLTHPLSLSHTLLKTLYNLRRNPSNLVVQEKHPGGYREDICAARRSQRSSYLWS